MSDQTVEAAITTLTKHVRENADITSWLASFEGPGRRSLRSSITMAMPPSRRGPLGGHHSEFRQVAAYGIDQLGALPD
jgi:hypothetical protein